MTLSFEVNGETVEILDERATLLAVLREQIGLHSVKDGCSPQGQCGCCTVLVDGAPRVSCVTPVRRVAGRSVTTLEGLRAEDQVRWGEAFCATGASQCGFCTPGIIVRLAGLEARSGGERDGQDEAPGEAPAAVGPEAVHRALAAHLCRCTGWNTMVEAFDRATAPSNATGGDGRNLDAASSRAALEGHTAQRVDPAVALGHGGFADDLAPADALVAVPDGTGGWALGESLAEARAQAGKVQGRRTTVEAAPPVPIPEGDWALTLATSWVEPAYLETDASWCLPGQEPFTPLANGGAFGGKVDSIVTGAARALADEHGRAVRVLLSREDTVRLGPKRPPVAIAMRADGTGIARVARTHGIIDILQSAAPWLRVEEVDVPGPPTSAALRGAGWVEATVVRAALQAARDRDSGSGDASVRVEAPNGSSARASVGQDRSVVVSVACGDPLDEIVLRSYCIGAAHMALSWVTSEGIAISDDGEVHDLTIRSFGILRPAEMPPVEVTIDAPRAGTTPVNGSDAVFAAVAAAVWLDQGCPPRWPTRLPWLDSPSLVRSPA